MENRNISCDYLMQDEYLDLVNEDDEIIGRKLRLEVYVELVRIFYQETSL